GEEHRYELRLLMRKDGEEEKLAQTFSADFSDRSRAKNEIKRCLYRMLRDYTGRDLPWGNLTGIRPTKIALTKLFAGESPEAIRKYMKETYYTGEEKRNLCVEVALREKELLAGTDPVNGYSLYAGIPFCPTTCLYCSFTSFPIGAWKGRTGAYLDAMFREMDYIAEKMQGKMLQTVYIGGGTPTALSPEDLDRLLTAVQTKFSMESVKEFTVESGRPDSITAEKLQVLRDHGISRISINPQTMKQETLDLIGRRHTVEEVLEKYRLAREMGFDNINMDLIVGLPGESPEDVAHTMEVVKELKPESVTVHSLAIKRAARLNIQKENYRDYQIINTQEMIDMTARFCREMGLQPYYLYRQKNMAGNFENVGYALPGKECLYNVLIMEEQQTIMACGAGTTTKFYHPEENRMERAENPKDVNTYMNNLAEMFRRKEALFADVKKKPGTFAL
ncbi:MAG: coproporphyrinogen dehydrogenase HemZ, partial [Clostridium sp.]|nr:coproporphyrinogen dehydrogenase HemZ [Clostridium sp.]